MLELSDREERIYNNAKRLDSLFFKLYFLKYSYENMMNAFPDDFNTAMDKTEKQNIACDKLNSAMKQAEKEMNMLMKHVRSDYDYYTDMVPF